MISCTEAIHAYNEFFWFLEERHGKEAVETFWRFTADASFEEPRRRIAAGGLDAIYEYMRTAWSEEGDVFDIERDDKGITVMVHNCSSVRKLRKAKHVKRYPDYCGHCRPMYQKLFGELGYDFQIDNIDPAMGICRIRVEERKA